jgi:hypothetical protein
MRKTKVRVVGDPSLCSKVSEVILEHFEVTKKPRKFDRAVGRDYSHSDASGCTTYFDIKREKEKAVMKCPTCRSQLTRKKFIDTWDADGKPDEVNEYFVCDVCQVACEPLDIKTMEPYQKEEASR